MRAYVLTALTLIACNKKGAEQVTKAPPAPPVKVDLLTVDVAQAPVVMTLTGMIAADQRSEVTADTAGKVIGVMVERGQRVKMGQPVVRLDVRSAALSAREAQANLAGAQAQKQLAEEECKRAQSLLDKGAITRSEYDRQSTQCTSALQQVSAAQARTEMINKSVADGLVRAPFDGIVSEKNVTPGEWVAPGRALFTLVDDDPLKVELSVPEVAVRGVKEGQDVTLRAVADNATGADKSYHAKLTRVGGEIGRTRSLIVEATLDPGSGLVPGMFVEAEIQVDQTQRPAVPPSAVALRGKTDHVFVAINGELQDRIVQLGPKTADGRWSIINGVAKGEKIVAKITDQTIDGLRVQ